ncbi:MAG TPA: hypothetical protein VF998_04490 [Candidatus Limnocylindria bacterium]
MAEREWLDAVFGTVRCANCGALYGRDAIAIVGNRDEYWFVRCTCGSCGAQGLGVVIVKQAAEPPRPQPQELSDGHVLRLDDVLEAHELLRDYSGDIHGLFERVSGR